MFATMIESVSREPGIALASLLGSLSLLAVTTIAVAAIVSIQWRKLRQCEELNALKHALLAQGLSADEIALVVEAGRRNPASGMAQATRAHLAAARY